MSILTDLEAELQAKTQDLSTLEAQLTALATEFADLQALYGAECNRLRQEIVSLDAQIADLVARIAGVQEAINNLKSQLGIS